MSQTPAAAKPGAAGTSVTSADNSAKHRRPLPSVQNDDEVAAQNVREAARLDSVNRAKTKANDGQTTTSAPASNKAETAGQSDDLTVSKGKPAAKSITSEDGSNKSETRKKSKPATVAALPSNKTPLNSPNTVEKSEKAASTKKAAKVNTSVDVPEQAATVTPTKASKKAALPSNTTPLDSVKAVEKSKAPALLKTAASGDGTKTAAKNVSYTIVTDVAPARIKTTPAKTSDIFTAPTVPGSNKAKPIDGPERASQTKAPASTKSRPRRKR